jgi:O-antigen/teichoic acid export membrane protein
VTAAAAAPGETAAFRQTLARNTFWYGVVTVAGLAAGLLMSVVLARGLGPAAMGDYSYLLWLIRLVTAVAMLGFAVATARYTAGALARGERAVAGAYLSLLTRRQAAVAAAVSVAALSLVFALPAPLRWPLVVAVAGVLPTTLEGIYAHAAYGAQRYDLTTQVSSIKMGLYLGAAIGIVVLGGGILGLMIGGTLVTVASCALQRRHARQLYPETGGVLPQAARVELRAYLIPLSAVAILDMVVWDRSEVFFLRLHGTSEAIAFYSVAFGLASRAMVAPEIVAGTLLPALSSLHGRGAAAEFQRVYREAMRLVTLVGAPLTALVAALAPGLVVLLYGEPYRPVGALLGPLLAVALVGVLREVAWSALRAIGDRRWTLHATWTSAVANVGLAALLIPVHGTWGAVAANASAQLVASVLAFVAIGARTGCRLPFLALGRITLAAAGAGAVVRAIAGDSAEPARLAGGVAAGAAAFLLAALLLGDVGAREWRLLVMAVPFLAGAISSIASSRLVRLPIDVASRWRAAEHRARRPLGAPAGGRPGLGQPPSPPVVELRRDSREPANRSRDRGAPR